MDSIFDIEADVVLTQVDDWVGYWKANTYDFLDPQDFIELICKRNRINLVKYKGDPSLGRIDLNNSKEVISLEFSLVDKIQKRGTYGYHMMGDHFVDIWGCKYEILISTLTADGKKNDFYNFVLLQPMLSRYPTYYFQEKNIEENVDLLVDIHKTTHNDYVLSCFNSVSTFLKHSIEKLK